jgi:hypothetical protein
MRSSCNVGALHSSRLKGVFMNATIWPVLRLRELIALCTERLAGSDRREIWRNYRLDGLFDRARERSACRTSRVICFANGCPCLSRSRVLRSRLSKERPRRLSTASMPCCAAIARQSGWHCHLFTARQPSGAAAQAYQRIRGSYGWMVLRHLMPTRVCSCDAQLLLPTRHDFGDRHESLGIFRSS